MEEHRSRPKKHRRLKTRFRHRLGSRPLVRRHFPAASRMLLGTEELTLSGLGWAIRTDRRDHGPSSLIARLVAYLDHWQIVHLVADCTRVGQGVVSYLCAHLGEQRVTPYDFSRPRAKADLGSAFLALVETNRFKYWSHERCDAPSGCVAPGPLSDAWWFFQQASACAYEIPPEGTIDHDLRWGGTRRTGRRRRPGLCPRTTTGWYRRRSSRSWTGWCGQETSRWGWRGPPSPRPPIHSPIPDGSPLTPAPAGRLTLVRGVLQ